VRYLAFERMQQALDLIPRSRPTSPRRSAASGGLVRPYQTDDADVIVVPWARCSARSRHRGRTARRGHAVASSHHHLRPFPAEAIRDALGVAPRHVVVLERALARAPAAS